MTKSCKYKYKLIKIINKTYKCDMPEQFLNLKTRHETIYILTHYMQIFECFISPIKSKMITNQSFKYASSITKIFL